MVFVPSSTVTLKVNVVISDGLGVVPLIVPSVFKVKVGATLFKLELVKVKLGCSGSEALISNKPVPVTVKFLLISITGKGGEFPPYKVNCGKSFITKAFSNIFCKLVLDITLTSNGY